MRALCPLRARADSAVLGGLGTPPRSDTQHRRNQPGSSAPKGDGSVRLDPGHDLRPGVYCQAHKLLCRSLCQPHTHTHARARARTHTHTHSPSSLSVRLTAATAQNVAWTRGHYRLVNWMPTKFLILFASVRLSSTHARARTQRDRLSLSLRQAVQHTLAAHRWLVTLGRRGRCVRATR
eukprot:COSAG03_NODE_6309_length_1081_cov_4.604888_1_plen_179_part_00